MQVIQRVFLIFISVLLFLFGWVGTCRKEERNLQKQWERIQANCFIKKVCEVGQCTYEDYMLFFEVLNYHGMDSVIQINEYRKECDMTGQVYYYLVSWEELKKDIFEENVCTFNEGSIIQIMVQRKSGAFLEQNSYYEVVDWKGR